ncbi:hypothetical protein [Maridesulfovibrio bastinii]|uniref:hypothetical protein n=1 Tax=Maridesulfovibrio bastinii TaxID=47157 RepID=UPI000426EC4F|nr:hypothetical protein [Maridesulfovibrio bastinii]
MARQDLTPNQAILFLHNSCCALETIGQLPETEVSDGAKVIIDLVKKAVCSCAVVLDDYVPADGGAAND